MTEVFLSYLLTSLVGTVAALVLFLIRPLTKKWFSASWHYYVWLVVLLVMLVPLKADVQKVNLWEEKVEEIDSNASIKTGFDVVTENENIVQIKSETVKPEAAAMGEEAKEESQQKTVPEEKTVVKKHQNETKTDIFKILAQIWFWGMIILFVYKIVKYKVFLRNILKNSEPVHLDNMHNENVEVHLMSEANSPFVVRLFKPILVLPKENISDSSMQSILAHELTHIKRHDIIYKWIVAICKAVHWFNPFMNVIAREIERACEISCDEIVVKNMNDDEKKSYADTILSFVSGYGRSIPFTTSMVTGKKMLKRRFIAIKNSKIRSKANAFVSVLVALVFIINFIAVSALAAGALLPQSIQMSNYSGLNIGDYVSLGKYRGESIVWRYVADDENGKLFWSDKFICQKPFGENDNWEKSPIRAWLNSDEQFMSIVSEGGYKYIEETYNQSPGFLYDSNFTASEKSLIKEVPLRTTYYEGWGLSTGKLSSYGTKDSFWREDDELNREYYLSMKSTWTTDKVFLLDLEQLYSIQRNIDVLGNCFTNVESITGNADEKSKYFIRTPLDGGYITGSMPLEAGYHKRVITIKNSIWEKNIAEDFEQDTYSSTSGDYFVRPAFYLNEENAAILSGNGTKQAPFVMDGKSAPNKFIENSLYGYKDNEGNVIIEPSYLKAGDFYENAALVILPENPKVLRVIKPDGEYLFDKEFSAVNNFNSGYALIVANDEGEYSYINKKGEVATGMLFDAAENFDDGFARVVLNGKSGVVDTLFNFYPDEEDVER